MRFREMWIVDACWPGAAKWCLIPCPISTRMCFVADKDELIIRPATGAEVDTIVDWAADEGWNPGLRDSALFHATDKRGFLIGYRGDTAVSAISAVSYGDTFGFIGFYIVKPGQRGQGYGLRIWKAAMARLAGRVIGLDGVIDQQANYRESGFALAHRNIRYGGTVGIPADVESGSGEIADSSTITFDSLAAYDAPFFTAPRIEFLQHWLQAPGHVGKLLMRDGKIAGYGVIRPCRDGSKIGPLFADDAAAADDLFRALAATSTGTVYLDTPEPNDAAIALAERYGMVASFETARMYAGPPPALPLGRIYGITTFELG